MSRFDHAQHVRPYLLFDWFADEGGHIVWRRGTGDNVELLHLRAYTPGHGDGKRLLRSMLQKLKDNPPYATVFGFTRVVNGAALAFYLDCGFELSEVRGVYADGKAVVFSQSYDRLVELHLCGTEGKGP